MMNLGGSAHMTQSWTVDAILYGNGIFNSEF